MAATRTLRPLGLALQNSSRTPYRQCYSAPIVCNTTRATNHERCPSNQRRSFLSNPLTNTPVQTISASRILRYPSQAVYSVISDVGSYSQFIPYCQTSTVTKNSSPAATDGKTYPEEAKLTIGFNDSVSEEFWSRVYCVPYHTVEAVSGNTDTSLLPDAVQHHSARPERDQDPTRNATVLSELLTKWTLRPYHYKPPPASALSADSTHKNHEETSDIPGQEKTEVSLTIQFKFGNPVYAALSQATAPKVADKMIEAFEKRVKAIVEGPGHA